MKILYALFLILTISSNALSQEIGVAPVKLWTDNVEISNTLGFGIYLSVPISIFAAKLELISAKNNISYLGLQESVF